jgi:equilibrative nucleoside transporter 1/2/3
MCQKSINGLSNGGIPPHSSTILYIIFFLLGMGTLFPWNAFITATTYFNARFCNTARAHDYLSFFGVTFNIFEVVSLAYCVKYNQSRVVGPLLVYTLVFVVTAALVPVISVPWLFSFTLASLAVVGICTALMTGGVFGLGALFPPIYTQAMMAGQGLAGLVTSVASIGTLLAVSPDDSCPDPDNTDDTDTDQCDPYTKMDWAAFSYFVVAVVTLLMCVVCYVALDKMPVTNYYRDRAKSNASTGTTDTTVDNSGEDMERPLLDSVGGVSGNESSVSEGLSHGGKIMSVVTKVKTPALSVFLTFAVTLALFPSITGSIDSVSKCDDAKSRFHNDLFVPVSFLLFNGGDFLGRSLAGYVNTENAVATKRILFTASVCRFVFFPLFLLCNVAKTKLEVVFDSDVYPIVFMLFFAVSNGLTSTVCMMVGPSMVATNEQEMAGNVMVFSLSSGLFMGSLLSFVCLKVGTGVW